MANRVARTYRFDRVDYLIGAVVLVALSAAIVSAWGFEWAKLVAAYLGAALMLFYLGSDAVALVRGWRRR